MDQILSPHGRDPQVQGGTNDRRGHRQGEDRRDRETDREAEDQARGLAARAEGRAEEAEMKKGSEILPFSFRTGKLLYYIEYINLQPGKNGETQEGDGDDAPYPDAD